MGFGFLFFGHLTYSGAPCADTTISRFVREPWMAFSSPLFTEAPRRCILRSPDTAICNFMHSSPEIG